MYWNNCEPNFLNWKILICGTLCHLFIFIKHRSTPSTNHNTNFYISIHPSTPLHISNIPLINHQLLIHLEAPSANAFTYFQNGKIFPKQRQSRVEIPSGHTEWLSEFLNLTLILDESRGCRMCWKRDASDIRERPVTLSWRVI